MTTVDYLIIKFESYKTAVFGVISFGSLVAIGGGFGDSEVGLDVSPGHSLPFKQGGSSGGFVVVKLSPCKIPSSTSTKTSVLVVISEIPSIPVIDKVSLSPA